MREVGEAAQDASSQVGVHLDLEAAHGAVTQHTPAWCSVQVIDIILTEGPIREYYVLQSGTTET